MSRRAGVTALARRGRGLLRPQRAMGVGRVAGRVVLAVLYRVEVRASDNVPASGAVVLVANHVGFLDGPVAFLAAPRPVHFLVKRSYFRGPLGTLLRVVGQIAITQNTADREALTAARGVLSAGGVLGVFPEGTRGDGSVSVAQQGAAFLALGSDAVVVPVCLEGTAGRTRGSWPRPRSRMGVTFGHPFRLADDEDVRGAVGRDRLRRATEVIRRRLADHVADPSAF